MIFLYLYYYYNNFSSYIVHELTKKLYYYQNIKVATKPKVGQEEIRMTHLIE